LIIVGNCRVHEIQLGSADGQAQLFKVRRNVDASSMFRHLQRVVGFTQAARATRGGCRACVGHVTEKTLHKITPSFLQSYISFSIAFLRAATSLKVFFPSLMAALIYFVSVGFIPKL
jgi:hypothetical protein